MDIDADDPFTQAERHAAEIADPATRQAITALIAAVRASTNTSDYRSDELH